MILCDRFQLKWNAWERSFLAALVVLYCLSPGPFLALLDQGFVSEDTMGELYAPLGWIGERSQIVESFYDWWMRMWGA
jgi:hypothetical protein